MRSIRWALAGVSEHITCEAGKPEASAMVRNRNHADVSTETPLDGEMMTATEILGQLLGPVLLSVNRDAVSGRTHPNWPP